MRTLESLEQSLRREPVRWLVTGAAGFIGSNIAQRLLELDQHVVGLDNFLTGSARNLDALVAAVGPERAARWSFIEGDIRDLAVCERASQGVAYTIHQAAIGSVPRSIDDPLETHGCNVTGFINIALAARAAGVRRVVYATSSAVYGDSTQQPNREPVLGRPLSPYATSKLADELYATAFYNVSGQDFVGLRYFNVFGPRQDPNGAYAAVIPRWIATLLSGERCQIFGDGETTRDFCFVQNVVDANLLAATAPLAPDAPRVFNIAGGRATTLNELYTLVRDRLASRVPEVAGRTVEHRDFRAGDIRHSVADITFARTHLGYDQRTSVAEGLEQAIDWYVADARSRA